VSGHDGFEANTCAGLGRLRHRCTRHPRSSQFRALHRSRGVTDRPRHSPRVAARDAWPRLGTHPSCGRPGCRPCGWRLGAHCGLLWNTATGSGPSEWHRRDGHLAPPQTRSVHHRKLGRCGPAHVVGFTFDHGPAVDCKTVLAGFLRTVSKGALRSGQVAEPIQVRDGEVGSAAASRRCAERTHGEFPTIRAALDNPLKNPPSIRRRLRCGEKWGWAPVHGPIRALGRCPIR
jgi:hypothetical protein